jgi:PAS domain S-box-containing protein
MGNVIQRRSDASDGMAGAAWAQLAGPEKTQKHAVQFYAADKPLLAKNVSRYLYDGLEQGDGLLVIATRGHTEIFTRELRLLGVDTSTAIGERRLIFHDAETMLAQFMVGDQPDWDCFEQVITSAIHDVVRDRVDGALRAYGEMVGILWKARQFAAAIRLEEFWNRMLRSASITLFCAYPIDIFGGELQTAGVEELLGAHTHMIPSGASGDLEIAVNRAVDDVLGAHTDWPKTHFLPTPHFPWAGMPRGETAILSVSKNIPHRATEILGRAREHYHSEKRFQALIENCADAIWLVSAQGDVQYASASTRRVLGYEPHEVVERDTLDLIHPEDADHARRTLKELLDKPHCPIQIEARMLHKEGSWRWVECSCSNLLAQPEIRAIVWNYRDISERKSAEEHRLRDAEDLVRANTELQAFAYAAAHDLKEPLRTICAFTELLVHEAQLDKNGQELAGFIVGGVKRMSVLLDDLLSFGSLTFHGACRMELRRAAEQAVQNLELAVSETGAKITIDSLPAVNANESHMVQLFQNLIANAIKYRSKAPIKVHVSAERLGSKWVIKVKDNGIGVASKYRDYVFGIFKRLHPREVPGTGIGLAICKKIVERMGGRIWVESEPANGSTFCFTIEGAD